MERQALLHDVAGQGEPIVLVPGALTGWLSWIPLTERLSAERLVVRVQLRSVELAEAGLAVPQTYGTATERDGLLATVDELGLERFDLAGWSYGGHVALAFALDCPERVRTLTLIEPEASWVLRETGRPPAALARNERFDRSLTGRAITIDDLKKFLVRAGFGQPKDDFESMPSWPIWVRNRQALSIIGTIWDYTNSPERLRELEIPILAVRGTDTTEGDAAIVDTIVATAPNATLLELPGDHASHLQNPDRFLEELRTHITGAPAR